MVWYSIVGYTSHSTHYTSFRRRFYGSDDPTNSVIALKDDDDDDGIVNQVKGQSHQAQLTKRQRDVEKDIRKNN